MGFLKYIEQLFDTKKVEDPYVVKYECKHHPPITDINVAKAEIKTMDDAKTQFMKLVKCECVGKSRIDNNYIYKISRAEVIPQGVRDIFEIAIVVQMSDNMLNVPSYDENFFHIKVSTKFPLHEVKDKIEKLNYHKNMWEPPAGEKRGHIDNAYTRTPEQQKDYTKYIADCLEKSKTQDVVISRREIPYESRPLGTTGYHNKFMGSYGNLHRLNE
ncbi:MAG: hypothetical protein WC979_01225 [Candidatus Pacearchaeota archaeon]|jgi:hypothetical protein|nr:hypothetical protein [Clostridia bacterium]